jgi:putative intracellular protease/amidase
MVVPREGYYVPDFQPMYGYFTRPAAGVEVTVASSERGPVRGIGGQDPQVVAELTVADAIRRASEFDAIYFAGKSPEAGANEFTRGGTHADEARRLIEAMRDQGKILASLCRGTIVLSNAGALSGRRAARGTYFRDDEVDAGINWVATENVVRDGQLLTGANPGDVKALTQQLVEMLRERRPDAKQ